MEPERPEHRLPAEERPDDPVPGIGHSEIGGRRAAEELQGHRDAAAVGDPKDERYRLAATGASRCLKR
jgi:hypothetical protein